MLTPLAKNLSLDSTLSAVSRAVVIAKFGLCEDQIVFANPAFTTLTGYEPRESFDRSRGFLEGPETDRGVLAEIGDAMMAGRSIRRKLRNYRKSGESFWNDLTIDPWRDEHGKLVGYIGVCVDASAEYIPDPTTIMERPSFEDISRHIPGYVYRRVLKPDGTLEHPYFSPSLNHLLELSEDTVATTRTFLGHIHAEDREPFMEEVRRSASMLTMFRLEFRLTASSGTVRWVRCDAPPRLLASGDVVWDGVALDITAAKIAQSEISFLASYDPLTGLSNRGRFKISLGEALETVPEGQCVALMSVDIHRLQDVNDALGQASGDEVLRLAGQRLRTFADRHGGTVARLGSDEFAVLLPRLSDASVPRHVAEAIFATLKQPMSVGGAELVMQSCLGAAVFPWPDAGAIMTGDPSAELLKRAAVALRAAKRAGPGVYRAYEVGTDERVRERVSLIHSLHRAIDHGQFELHYQPLVDLALGKIVGAEALARWNHPTLGMQRPDQFIPLAEESGVIGNLGAWVLRRAMEHGQNRFSGGRGTPRIAINVSGVQLRAENFMSTVERALAETGADARRFELELTETSMIDTSGETKRTLHRLREMGFWITIDDFGAGHSTFTYLREFPVDKIKIDQSFVRGVTTHSCDASIIRSMIALARDLGLQVVAEGVETEFQRRFLLMEGCLVGQGYLFSPALDAEEFAELLGREAKLPLPRRQRHPAVGPHAAPSKDGSKTRHAMD